MNMEMQHAVMMPVDEQKFNDDIIFSTINLCVCNPCCLGLSAFCNSVKSRDSRVRRDLAAAHSYGSRARCLNIAAVIITVISIIATIIFLYRLNQTLYSRLNI